MPADSEQDRLPFEPKRKRKGTQKAKVESTTEKKTQTPRASQSSQAPRKYRREDADIPEIVSRRMFRRMIFFSGIPVILGLLVFFASYVIIVQGIAELPNVVVLLMTLACFGLSVVGLSYGALSASWEEDSLGTMLGFEQFQVNFERLIGSWRQAREERRNSS